MSVNFSSYRKEAGFETQNALAITLGIGRSSVAKWEVGISYPHILMLEKLSKALKKSEGEIIASITAAKNKSPA